MSGVSGQHGDDDVRDLLGAYALEHLGRAESRRVRRHLRGCADCRRELEGIGPVAERLRILRGSQSASGQRSVPTSRSRGMRRPVALLAAAAAAAVLAGGAGVVLGRTTAPSPEAAPIEPVTLQPRSAGTQERIDEAGLIAHTWGVELRMSGENFDAGAVYRVRFRDRDGDWMPAGEFVGVGDAELDCSMQSGLLREDAVRVEVRDPGGEVVLSAAL